MKCQLVKGALASCSVMTHWQKYSSLISKVVKHFINFFRAVIACEKVHFSETFQGQINFHLTGGVQIFLGWCTDVLPRS